MSDYFEAMVRIIITPFVILLQLTPVMVLAAVLWRVLI